MQIAVLGAGAIGSTFAFQLSRAGHEVTVVARGNRLEQLLNDRAIVRTTGERASVTVAKTLDPDVTYDLVLVTVLAPQMGAVLPTLRASAARTVMFMFNTFERLDALRDAVGQRRFAFGFPGGVFVLLEAGRIAPQIRPGTAVSAPEWARVFTTAGIPTVVDDNMQSWLRSHAALVVPLMSAGVHALTHQRGISWPHARLLSDAFSAGVRIVRALGNDVRPKSIAVVARWPRSFVAAALWVFSRTQMGRDLGKLGSAEPRMLIDMMHAAAPNLAAPLLRVRP